MITLAAMMVIVATLGPMTSEPSLAACADAGMVTLDGPEMEIRAALRSIGHQGNLRIAIAKGVRGHVRVPSGCVKARVALSVVLGQVGAASCDNGQVIYVYRSGRMPCTGLETLPPPVARVSSKQSRLQAERRGPSS